MIRLAMERSWSSGEINSPKPCLPVPFGFVSKFYPRADVASVPRTNRDSLTRRLDCNGDRWHCLTVGKSLENFFPKLLADAEERSLALSRSFFAMRRQSGVWLSELDPGATMEFAQRLPRHGASRRKRRFRWWEFPRFLASMTANISPSETRDVNSTSWLKSGAGLLSASPSLLTREQVEAELHKAPHLPIFASAPIEFLPDASLRTPSAAKLGVLAADWAPNDPQPLYLKAAHITTPKRGTNDSDVEDQRSSERGRCYFPTAASSAGGVSALESDAKPRYFLPLFLTIPRETRF